MRSSRCESTRTSAITAQHARGVNDTHSAGQPALYFLGERALADNEVLIDVMYCGVSHTDLKMARGSRADTKVNMLLGQEIVGRIRAHGSSVSAFKPGDIVGVGAMAASCGRCDQCVANVEQYCQNAPISTRDYQRRRPVAREHADQIKSIVVTAPFLIRIPTGSNLAATAPLLGAAIATYSPMQHWKLKPGQHVGVIGMGGLGHMAVKLAAARQADVTVFTTSPDKRVDARRFGAREALLWNDEAAFDRLANQFDLLISTVPQSYSILSFMDLLKGRRNKP